MLQAGYIDVILVIILIVISSGIVFIVFSKRGKVKKDEGIKPKAKKHIITAYFAAGALFLAEYIYYKVTVSFDVMHYSNFLLSIYEKPVTQYSGLHIIALLILLFMPIVIFILKKKTLFRVIICIIIFAINLFICMMLFVFIASSDAFGNHGLCYFDKAKQPGGGIIICSQITEDYYDDMVNIYVETGFNTLKEIRNTNIPRGTRQKICWEDDRVKVVLYKKGKNKKISVKKSFEISFDELRKVY